MDTKIFKLGSQRVKKLRVSVIETTRPERALEQRCVPQLQATAPTTAVEVADVCLELLLQL